MLQSYYTLITPWLKSLLHPYHRWILFNPPYYGGPRPPSSRVDAGARPTCVRGEREEAPFPLAGREVEMWRPFGPAPGAGRGMPGTPTYRFVKIKTRKSKSVKEWKVKKGRRKLKYVNEKLQKKNGKLNMEIKKMGN